MTAAESRFRPDIEGLRALAIVLVIVYHYASTWMPGGYVGVDVFFVISGYLITLTLVEVHQGSGTTRRALFEFWSRRARRLLPNALLVLAACAVVGMVWLPDPALSRLGSDIAWAGAYSINWLFVVRAVEYLRWGETEASPLLNYWSLAVEEQFYLVWPLLLFALLRRGEGAATRLKAATVLALGLALLSLIYAIALGQTRLTTAFFSSPARAWELLVGAWLALRMRRGVSFPWLTRHGGWVAWAGLGTIVSSAITFSRSVNHPGLVTLLPVAGAALMMAGMAAQPQSVVARAMGCAPMRMIGARSYSLYLWHWPTLVLGGLLWPGQSAVRGLLLFLLSVLLAEAAFRWVEAPTRWRWGRAMAATRLLGLAVTAGVAMMVAGLGLRSLAEQGDRQGTWLEASTRVSGLPPLRQTQNDLPVVYRNGCHLGIAAVAPPPQCRLGGTPDGPDVVLFGDSHAAQWVPALVPVATERAIATLAWTKSGCPSADVTVWSAATRGIYRECDAWREAVFDRMASHKPALVIVSNLIDEAASYIDRDSGAVLRGDQAAAEFRAGLERTLRRLRDLGVPVVLIRDNPKPRSDVIDCLYSLPDPQRCERPRDEALDTRAPDAAIAAAYGIPVWDFTDQVCGTASCPVVMPHERRSIYRDDNHLSASFVASLVPAVRALWSSESGRRR